MNLFSMFNRKTDGVVVCKLRCGFNFLSKVESSGTVPFMWEAWLYENAKGKRWIKTRGNLNVDRSAMKSLKNWVKHKVIIQVIPSYHGITTGQLPYEVEWTP